MTTLVQRITQLWRTLFAPDDLLTLLMTGVLVLMPILALKETAPQLRLETVLPVLALSMIFGFLLARSRYDELFALMLSGIYSAAFVLLIASINESGGIIQGATNVLNRLILWLIDAFSGGINQDEVVLSMLIAALFWYLSYNAIWHVFRVDRIWRVLLPPAMLLLANIIIYSGEASLDRYLLIFLFVALILIVRSNLTLREWDWYVNGVRVPRHLRTQFMRVGAILALIALFTAWIIPTNDLQERLDNFQEFLQSDPLRDLTELWNRLIAPIESEGPATADYYGSDSLNLSGAVNLGDQVVMLVNAPNDRRYYWRSRTFERYDGGRWSSSATLRITDRVAPLDIYVDDEVIGQARQEITQTVTVGTGGTRLIYTAPQPIRVNLTGRMDLLRTRDPDSETSPVNIAAIRPLTVLQRGSTYQVVSAMSIATADQLRAAGTDYPYWVANPNAFVGFSVSGRVIQLARQIVDGAGAVTPYDQAKAIESWLRRNITYNERIPLPPQGADPIEWFLFEAQQGYCTYYATSMVLMLRSLGIPARMAAGFAEGEWDAEVQQYVVRENDAHTWVEVYFPGYGWVEFEPTASEQDLNRDGDNAPNSSAIPEPTTTIEPPITPSATPTLIPSPTMPPSPTPREDEPQNPPFAPTMPPTITPTPSPTPTATPIIVPTVVPPIQPPPSSNFADFLLSAVGLGLVLLLLIVLLTILLAFIWWWWEWRGMGGLNPIARAYARLERYMGLLGMRTRAQQTPEEKRQSMVGQLPQAEKPITAITRSYMASRYGQRIQEGTAEHARRSTLVEQAWQEVRNKILGRWLRLRLPWGRRKP